MAFQDDDNKDSDIQSQFTLFDNQEETASLRGVSRFLVQKTLLPANFTCNKFPRICRLKNSPGPDCCKKKCSEREEGSFKLWDVWVQV
ncbi:hypothetical protein L1049_010128 [Liquidambar formosana]|uniref:Uncharacterized protein n=1 Tax=Liquidambar formosana TaxID=63359 RepID=A0AAP0N994_LIQFO